MTKLELSPNDGTTYDEVWIAALTENITGNNTFVKLNDNFSKIIKSY